MHCNCAHPAQESAFKIAQIPPFYRVGDGPKRIHGTQAEAAAPSASVIWCIPGACFCIQKMHCRASGDAQIPRFCIVRDDTSQRDVRTTHPSCPMDEGAGTTNGRPESTGPPSGTGSGARESSNPSSVTIAQNIPRQQQGASPPVSGQKQPLKTTPRRPRPGQSVARPQRIPPARSHPADRDRPTTEWPALQALHSRRHQQFAASKNVTTSETSGG